MFCTIMWHRPAGRCIFMYVNIQMIYIYMSRYIFAIKCVTCVLSFDDDDDVDGSYML
jgi:hypothetical protein